MTPHAQARPDEVRIGSYNGTGKRVGVPNGLSVRHNASWMLGATAGRTAIQGTYFVLVARYLGPSEFGLFAAILALASALVPFADLGAGNVLILRVARDRSALPESIGTSLLILATAGSALTVASVVLGYILFGIGPAAGILWYLAASELLVGRLVSLLGQAFQSIEQLSITAVLSILPGATRLAAITVLVALGTPATAADWAAWYFGASMLSGLLAVAIAYRRLGALRFPIDRSRLDLRTGVYFAIGLSARSLYTDLDKILLARLSTPAATGIYTAAYRVVFMALAPVQALLAAMTARLYRLGGQAGDALHITASRLLRSTSLYAAAVGLGLFLGAPLIPTILGPGFADSATALRWLSPLPLIQSLHFGLGDAVTALDRQRERSVAQIGVAAVNALLCFALLPTLSWRGAAIATLVAELLLVGALGVIFLKSSRLHRVSE